MLQKSLTGRHVLALLLASMIAQPATAQVASERQLREVQQKIEALASEVGQRMRDRDSLSAELGTIEKRMSEARMRRGQIDIEAASARARQQEIAEQQQVQQANLALEQSELARQLRAAYTSGRQERLKLLLNQQTPETLGRTLVYYRYLSDARIVNMQAFRAALTELETLRDAAAKTTAELQRLAAETDGLIASLTEDKRERQRLIAAIEARLADEQSVLAELQQREGELKTLLSDLNAILDDYPTHSEEPLSSLRGNLTWPVAGFMRSGFGSSLAGGRVRSKGVVLEAPSGSEVRAIYHGRVAFADWLPGMGLLIIVDHGEDILSLYGYNETLQKSVGDWISPGEIIATVGNSGGQSQPALYFEIRRGTTALNPRPWFKRRPGPQQR